MPAHSSDYLQPLDIGCYASLKIMYGRLVQKKMLAGVNHIDKQDFLPLYLQVRPQAFSPSNIKSGFKATGLFPLDSSQILSRLQIKSINKPVDKPVNKHVNKSDDNQTPSPPKSSNVSKTPYNINQLATHTERLFQHHPQNPDSPVSKVISQLIKGCEIAMRNASFLLTKMGSYDQKANGKRKRKNKDVYMSLMVGL
jgi:hypothetical protein